MCILCTKNLCFCSFGNDPFKYYSENVEDSECKMLDRLDIRKDIMIVFNRRYIKVRTKISYQI